MVDRRENQQLKKTAHFVRDGNIGRHVDDTHSYPYVITHLLTKFHNGHIDIQICARNT
jgi:hypothetical protein